MTAKGGKRGGRGGEEGGKGIEGGEQIRSIHSHTKHFTNEMLGERVKEPKTLCLFM